MILNLVEEGGFEPPKSMTADLQSAPFGRSGTLPIIKLPDKIRSGAGGRTRTPDLLITNQLLYQLSYTSVERSINISQKNAVVKHFLKKILTFLFYCFLHPKKKKQAVKTQPVNICTVIYFFAFFFAIAASILG